MLVRFSFNHFSKGNLKTTLARNTKGCLKKSSVFFFTVVEMIPKGGKLIRKKTPFLTLNK
jgi:hypothetical protein